ncbi:MAG: class I SAM-dependent methyltransferase [Candidatus Promineifilaceae bacterium]
MVNKEYHEANRISWNAATQAHNSHKADQAKFFREGGQTLYPEEIELLGDLHGRSLVHLQCNAGQDTLSIARLGAAVTGVDISDVAIDFARKLSADSGIPAAFHRSDVYDWLADTAAGGQRFDVVFSSYGALCWLSDLRTWAKGVEAILNPDGRIVLVDFHPYAMIFDDDWSFGYDYFKGEPIAWDDGIGDYVAMSGELLAPSGYLPGEKDFVNPNPSYEFQWPISEIITALLEAGLRLTTFKEYPYFNGAKLLNDMRQMEDGRVYPPEGFPSLPLTYAITATKD